MSQVSWATGFCFSQQVACAEDDGPIAVARDEYGSACHGDSEPFGPLRSGWKLAEEIRRQALQLVVDADRYRRLIRSRQHMSLGEADLGSFFHFLPQHLGCLLDRYRGAARSHDNGGL